MAPELIFALTLGGVALVLVTYWVAQPRFSWPWQRRNPYAGYHTEADS